jgi:hypothetical protein
MAFHSETVRLMRESIYCIWNLWAGSKQVVGLPSIHFRTAKVGIIRFKLVTDLENSLIFANYLPFVLNLLDTKHTHCVY